MKFERVEPPQVEDKLLGIIDASACSLWKDQFSDLYYTLCVDGFVNLYHWRIRKYCVSTGKKADLREATTKYRIKTDKPCKVTDHFISDGAAAKKEWEEAYAKIASAETVKSK
jgi:hypothetical protein